MTSRKQWGKLGTENWGQTGKTGDRRDVPQFFNKLSDGDEYMTKRTLLLLLLIGSLPAFLYAQGPACTQNRTWSMSGKYVENRGQTGRTPVSRGGHKGT